MTVGLFIGYHSDKTGQSPQKDTQFNLSMYDLHEQYLPAWEVALTGDEQALGVMCSHAAMNSTPSCANTFLLQDTLRDRWQSNAVVRSDCCKDIDNMVTKGFRTTNQEALVAATKAGLEYCFGCGIEEERIYQNALHQNQLQEEELDNALEHAFINRFRLGEFAKNLSTSPFGSGFKTTVDSAEHRYLPN